MTIDWDSLPRDRFGDDPRMQDELARLVVLGRKTATCLAADAFPAPRPGDLTVIEDGSGRPVCVIETVQVEQRKFLEVDAGHASAEGEGDLSLEWWRKAHRDYFTREGTFSEDMTLHCERFRLVEVAPEGAA
ncbi:MAG: ASCH domain-containing protein [Pseudomonadota bacterium]|nr:ASCH domain-containing protein [Pseudomonadota bacterium]